MDKSHAMVAALPPALLKLRLIQLRPERYGWIKYLFLPLVLLIAVIPDKGTVNADLRALQVFITACLLVLYAGYAIWKERGPYFTEIGQLASSIDELMLTVEGHDTSFGLHPATQVMLTYRGFNNEVLTTRIRTTGIDNFIQINRGETYRFEMPSEQAQEALRRELRRWYHLKVKVKEQRQDGPTFLLHRGLSYEQIQAYKQGFGVGLYG
jgi:hypothetical protein